MKIFSTFILVWTACTCLFLIQFIIVMIEYFQGKTGVGRSLVDPGAPKLLPCLTFCPMPAFKSTNFTPLTPETSMESFLNLTYGREDIFSNKSNVIQASVAVTVRHMVAAVQHFTKHTTHPCLDVNVTIN